MKITVNFFIFLEVYRHVISFIKQIHFSLEKCFSTGGTGLTKGRGLDGRQGPEVSKIIQSHKIHLHKNFPAMYAPPSHYCYMTALAIISTNRAIGLLFYITSRYL
jgi:hypothetical protein